MAKSLGKTRKDAKLAAEAIMTTDTKSKEVAVEIEIEGKKAVVAGMCKGSGMIPSKYGNYVVLCGDRCCNFP